MGTTEFKISVIIPSYNSASFLAEAVKNVLQQEIQPLEILIVDDGSTDDTAAVAARLPGPIRYVHQTNSGPSAARNRGLELARGNIIGFLDADDLWAEDKSERQLTVLQARPEVEVVQGFVQWMCLVDTSSAERRYRPLGEPYASFNLGSALFRREVFDRIGYFDATLHHSEDVDWFLRAREQGVSILVQENIALYYRIHESNISQDKLKRRASFLQVIKMSLDRRKELGKGVARPVAEMERTKEG
jgi:glycosyltransferase involved in cell wall biosynthesis